MGALLALTPYPQEPDEVYFFANLVSKLFAAEVLGIPWSDIDMLGAWSASLRFSPLGRDPLLGEGPLHPDSEQATLRLQEYFSAHLAQQRSTRSVNLITMLDAVESRGATLSDDDLVSLCIQVLAGSLETLPNFFQNSLLVLSDHPEQWHKLNQDPSPRQSLIDELLRYNKVGEQVRVTTTDVKLGNKVLSRGDRVIVLISAANRDGARFPEPDKFDACRRENRHIAFGSGPHYCLGAALTRLEAEVFVQALRESLS
jgi:cytochrome P450